MVSSNRSLSVDWLQFPCRNIFKTFKVVFTDLLFGVQQLEVLWSMTYGAELIRT